MMLAVHCEIDRLVAARHVTTDISANALQGNALLNLTTSTKTFMTSDEQQNPAANLKSSHHTAKGSLSANLLF